MHSALRAASARVDEQAEALAEARAAAVAVEAAAEQRIAKQESYWRQQQDQVCRVGG